MTPGERRQEQIAEKILKEHPLDRKWLEVSREDAFHTPKSMMSDNELKRYNYKHQKKLKKGRKK